MTKHILSRSALVMVGVLALVAPASAQQAQSGSRAPRAVTPMPQADPERERTAPQAFSVVLVLGDMQTTAVQDTVPAAARKALADLKDFLPYKGYRLLDAQWTLCCGNYPITSRLKGADEQEYELQLSTSLAGPGRVTVRFNLSEAGSSAETSAETRARIGELEQQLAMFRRQYNASSDRGTDRKLPEMQKLAAQIEFAQQQLAELKGTPAARTFARSRGIIDTSFRMDVGETVVVGTSRIKGDKALIALLTAVPPKASTGR